jgi:hypothetical protein
VEGGVKFMKRGEGAQTIKVWEGLVYSVYKISLYYLLIVWHYLGPDDAGLLEIYCSIFLVIISVSVD